MLKFKQNRISWEVVWQCQALSRVQLFVTPWTVAHQAPLSMGFSRQEYWSGMPCPPLGDLPNPGTKSGSPAFQADSLLSELQGSLGKGIFNGQIHVLKIALKNIQETRNLIENDVNEAEGREISRAQGIVSIVKCFKQMRQQRNKNKSLFQQNMCF